ncbi:toll-interacting protein [Galendromus occidentalis]|uniref:Toll-interacting protein n=1 Tax=Galendromus occidentalis TaxID=34638 RepID=A0AAJ6VYD1_9ACAR|nr:toll-interacting protein [Galendromus occidentalis]
MASPQRETAEERRKKVLVGELPEDFLRLNVSPPAESVEASGDLSPGSQRARQIASDEQAAIAMQRQMEMLTTSQNLGRLTLTVVEARLVKNYGMTRMDPYVRLRIGHNIYETNTHYNGAKNPRWDKVFHCFIPPGVNSFLIEIFDECAFTASEKIAWAHVQIPEAVITAGETNEEWIPLNGKQGDGKEGAINLVMSYTVIPRGSMISPQVMYLNGSPVPTTYGYGSSVRPVTTVVQGVPMHPTGIAPGPVLQAPAMVQPVQPRPEPPAPTPITEEDFKQLQEMFPSVEKTVIESVLESHNGDKNRAISDLLQLTN